MKHVALLRGINVGGKNKLLMKDLAAIFTAAGCKGVTTFIQSGNVVFEGPTTGLAAKIEKAIEKKFGFRPPIQFRSAAQLEQIVHINPFIREDENYVHVVFLADVPATAAMAALDSARSPGDRFHVSGQEIYLHVPNGMGETKLTNAWFDSKLSTISTSRNWRTTLKLLELASAS
jgi:uncharacterized protein (DUF1697 family)